MPSLPDDVVEIGSIYIGVHMGPHGRGTQFTIDSLSPEEAIGHLTIVLDRMREDRALSWHLGDDHDCLEECPHCGEDLFPDDEDED